MSLFAPWRGANGMADEHDNGPLTAPGGWSNLLTWRPSQRPNANRFSSSTFYDAEEDNKSRNTTKSRLVDEDDDEYEEAGDDDDDDDNEQSPQQMYTARARQRGANGGAVRPRAPIPFDLEPYVARPVQQPRRKGKTSSISSFDNAVGLPTSPMKVHPSRLEAQLTPSLPQGVDSADVSAELELASELSADLSIDGVALDSAFQTLTRIRAKDVAASTSGRVISSSSSTHTMNGSSSAANSSSQQRRPSLVYRTPNESPTQHMSGTWMQWGTERIRATLPRGLTSALFTPNDDTGLFNATVARRSSDIDEEDDSFDGEEDHHIPAVVRDCIDIICGRGIGSRQNGGGGLLDTEGLFRISPSNALLKQARNAYSQGKRPDLRTLSQRDPHLPAALLKDYLRSLRPPLISEDMYDDIQACPLGDANEAIAYVRIKLLPRLSQRRLALLGEVLACAHSVSQRSSVNRMDPANLAIVITPSLVHGSDVMRDVAICSVPSKGDSSEFKSTLGTVFVLCMERYEELFTSDDTDENHGSKEETPNSVAWEKRLRRSTQGNGQSGI